MLDNLYKIEYDFLNPLQGFVDMGQKLFCTFTPKADLHETLYFIQSRNTVLYSKIFVLEIYDQPEYVCTYNVDIDTVRNFPENTILVHRKKESNTLYIINALNELIRMLNNGYLDKNFRIDWNRHRNSILLTKGDKFHKLSTALYKVVELG